jgi:hypothetical protein
MLQNPNIFDQHDALSRKHHTMKLCFMYKIIKWYRIKLPLGRVYNESHIHLGPIPKIPHCVYAKIPKSESLLVPVFW